jgi:HEAT repeat protein
MRKVELDFSEVIDSILAVDENLEYQTLVNLSDLNPSDIDVLASSWNTIPEKRRLELFENLYRLGKEDTVLSFLEISRFALEDECSGIRILALQTISLYDEISILDSIERILIEDPDQGVQLAAVSGLGKYILLGELDKIPSTKYQNLLVNLTNVLETSISEEMRHRALESLGYSAGKEIETRIIEAYNTGETKWLMSALRAMGRSADERWASDVHSMLDHNNNEVRLEAIRAAGELELLQSVNKLVKILFEIDDERITQACIRSLSQIGGEEAKDALEELYEQCEDPEQLELIEQAHDQLLFYDGFLDFPIFNLPEDGSVEDIIQDPDL